MIAEPKVWTVSSIAMLQGRSSDGWLPMTRAGETDVVGWYKTRYPFAKAHHAIRLEYDYVSWGGTGGSGHSIYLFDPSVPGAGTGGAADGAGYRGLVGAYVGIVFDVDGSFNTHGISTSGGPNFYVIAAGQADNYVIESFDSIYGPSPQDLTYPTQTSRQKAIDAGCVKHVVASFVPDADLSRYRVSLSVNNLPIFVDVPHGLAFATQIPPELKLGISAANGRLTSNQELCMPTVALTVMQLMQ